VSRAPKTAPKSGSEKCNRSVSGLSGRLGGEIELVGAALWTCELVTQGLGRADSRVDYGLEAVDLRALGRAPVKRRLVGVEHPPDGAAVDAQAVWRLHAAGDSINLVLRLLERTAVRGYRPTSSAPARRCSSRRLPAFVSGILILICRMGERVLRLSGYLAVCQ
jgi:hypothetical protein